MFGDAAHLGDTDETSSQSRTLLCATLVHTIAKIIITTLE